MIHFNQKKGFICDMDGVMVLVLSGVSSKETPELYAYQPTMILNGVGDIVTMAEGCSRFLRNKQLRFISRMIRWQL